MLSSIGSWFGISQSNYSDEKVQKTPRLDIQTTNQLSATLAGCISRILIERNFFQSIGIPAEMALYLTNDLIKVVSPYAKKAEALNVPKELAISWKELTGLPLSKEEQVYVDSPRQLDVVGEILNGLKYSSIALVGTQFHGAVTAALSERLWGHVPAICAYFGAAVGGPYALAHAVACVLQNSSLTAEQQMLVAPWLNMIGRSALGFIPRVHATEQGVHYHFPSLSGSSHTYSANQIVSVSGETLSVERTGHFQTPQGLYEGSYIADFKIGRFHELSEERIRMDVIDSHGISVPIVFTKTLGFCGPEVAVSCENKHMERLWSQHVNPQPISAPPIVTERRMDALALSTLSLTAGLLAGKSPAYVPALGTLMMLSIPKVVRAEGFTDEVPVGFIMAYAAGDERPKDMGYVRCDGALHPKETYPELYETLQGVYSETDTHFHAPDCRGLFLRGAGEIDVVGKVSEDSTRMPRIPFMIDDAGQHQHTMNLAGQHAHELTPEGEHTHYVSYDGLHKHQIESAGTHKHENVGVDDHGHNDGVFDQMFGNKGSGHFVPKGRLDSFTGRFIGAHGYGKASSLPAGAHTHDMHHAGEHAHEMESEGVHQHILEPALPHLHQMVPAGEHDHEIEKSGEHSHVITGGDEETSPKNLQVAYWIKAKLTGNAAPASCHTLEESPNITPYRPPATPSLINLVIGVIIGTSISTCQLRGLRRRVRTLEL